ncbi:MAG: hypothetical protein ACREDR_02215 [Blastocatellia bacterium]
MVDALLARESWVYLFAPVFILLMFGSAFAQGQDAPLNQQYVTEVIRKHAVGEDFLIDTIKQRGVDFELTDALKARLSDYGASGELLGAIADNYRAPSQGQQSFMSGTYEGKIGKGEDARRIKLLVRDTGIKLEGGIEYDKAKGVVTNGLMKDGEITVEFIIGKDKGLINGHYKEGRISGELNYGGKVEKVKLRWTVAIQSAQ